MEIMVQYQHRKSVGTIQTKKSVGMMKQEEMV